MIRVQVEDFDINKEYQRLSTHSSKAGAVVIFTGIVREIFGERKTNIFLEHYPDMTEKVLQKIIRQTKENWPIIDVTIIHRIGYLSCGDNIVFVGVNSPHRKEAFAACEEIMKFLKSEAPFWKKEITESTAYWVDPENIDNA